MLSYQNFSNPLSLVSNLIEFFYDEPPKHLDHMLDRTNSVKSVAEFVHARFNNCPADKEFIIHNICNKLVELGYLIHYNPPINQIVGRVGSNKTYHAHQYDKDSSRYGVYGFQVFGFPLIREHFSKSVLPIIPTKNNDDLDIGTCFLFRDQYLITAKHCIENMQSVSFRKEDIDLSNNNLEEVFIPSQKNLDLAILKFSHNFENPTFESEEGHILDKIMTMGYPHVPNFDAIQTSETATVASIVPIDKATTGEVVAHEASYLTYQNYFLISARIKGGNSGGPAINERGKVIGVITEEIRSGSTERAELDKLGYGVVTPSSALDELFNHYQNENDNVQKLTFSTNFQQNSFSFSGF